MNENHNIMPNARHSRILKAVFVVVSLILIVALIVFSTQFLGFITNEVDGNKFGGAGNPIVIPANQTLIYSVTSVYKELPPHIGSGTTSSNNSDVIQFGPHHIDTPTEWMQKWLDVDISLNGTDGAGIRQTVSVQDPYGATTWEAEPIQQHALGDRLVVQQTFHRTVRS